MKIKILYVLNDMRNGGTEAFVMNYYRRLDRNIFDADFLVLSGTEEYYGEEISANGDKVIHISEDNKKNFFTNYFKVRNFLKKNQYDIIHINSCSMKFMAQIAHAAKSVTTAKIIGHAHSIGEPENTITYKISSYFLKSIIENRIDYAMSCSKDSAQSKFMNSRIESDYYATIPNAIELSNYKYNEIYRNEIRERYGLKNDACVIGIVGRLEKYKNQSFLLDVIKQLNLKQDTYLMMVGDGDIRGELEQKAEDLGIRNKAIFVGMVKNAYAYYSAMDIFCLPSYSEGFPFVLVEAQANGLKCFVSDETTDETDISGTVVYIDRHDLSLWVDKIQEYGCARIDDEAVCKVEGLFSLENAVKILEKIYLELVDCRVV